MKVKADKSFIGKKITLSEVGVVEVPDDGIIEVPEGVGNGLISNLNFTLVEGGKPAKADKGVKKNEGAAEGDENGQGDAGDSGDDTGTGNEGGSSDDNKISEEDLKKLKIEELVELAKGSELPEAEYRLFLENKKTAKGLMVKYLSKKLS